MSLIFVFKIINLLFSMKYLKCGYCILFTLFYIQWNIDFYLAAIDIWM